MRLTAMERRWLLLVFDTILPSGADARLQKGAVDYPMDRFVDALFARAPAQFCVGLRVCLWFLMACPLFLVARPRTFAGLPRGARVRVLERLGRSSVYVIREIPLLFKTAACLGYGGLPEVQAKVGITPVDGVPPDWARRSLPKAD
jgi:hypothetical protein